MQSSLQRNCLYCQKSFTGRAIHAVYCCRSCKNKATARVSKKRIKANKQTELLILMKQKQKQKQLETEAMKEWNEFASNQIANRWNVF